MAVNTALQGAAAAGAMTDLIDLAEFDLPLCNGAKNADAYPPGVARLRERVKSAGGLIIGTPEYHGGVSGVLKNALDLMGFDEFEGKLLGLVGVSGGAMGAFDALNTLRSVGRNLHSWVIPTQAAIAEAYRVFDANGNIQNAALAKRLTDVGREVARFALLHRCEEHVTFLRDWEQAQPNHGGAGM